MDPLYQKHSFSLLWPDYAAGRAKEQAFKSGEGVLFNQDIMERDINANMILQGMDIRTEGKDYIVARISDMVTDNETIVYRQAILKDFLKYPELEVLANTDLLPLIIQLGRMEKTNLAHDDDVRKTVWRMELLKIYVQCVTVLDRIFCSANRTFDSDGLNKLRELITSIVNDQNYHELVALLPTLSDDIKGIQSVTLGVNLDNELHPVESVLLSVSEKPIKKRGMLSKLFGTKNNEEKYFGIGTWYSILRDNSAGTLDAAIMRDLSSVMKDTFRNLADSLNRYERVESAFLFELMPEISFYIGGTHLVNKLRSAGLPVCFPKALPMDERRFFVKDIYDLSFAIRVMSDTGINKLDNVIVTNDFVLGEEEGRIGILTGANQGGKTTITRALGLCQLMFQAGLPVAGTSGEISPCDNIYTHFPELEKNSVSEGRLGEECVRLEQILPKLTNYSMILMNESLSSTSHQECLFIATEIMKYLRTIGARALFATHIHELAENIPELNKEPGLSNMMSLVAGIDESSGLEVMTEDGIKKFQTGSKRTYKITRMPPQGRSFALDIARTYGISYDQLINSHEKETSK
ncbi:MAG: hypothetical protein J5921_04730 [Clostridia bacterium]|nr:hypothetical protein [Clostridia bacterium]